MGELIDFLALVVLLAAGASYGVWRVSRRAAAVGRRGDSLGWVAAHRSEQGTTTVRVELRAPDSRTARESREVEKIRDDDPDYDAKLVSALISARSRAGLLNSQDSMG